MLLITAPLAPSLTGPGAPARAADPPADLVLTGGRVYTLDGRRPLAEAIAVRGALIAAVGSRQEIAALAGPATRVVELGGATVVPGLVEGHGHLLNLGAVRLGVDLIGTASYEEVVRRVEAALRTRPAGEWILGRGWHESKWTGAAALPTVRGFPTHQALSAISPQHPVALRRADGHAVLVNARAMALMRITRETQAPSGGEIVRDARGEPTGVLVDRAMDLVRVPPPTPEQLQRSLELGLEECLANGITAFCDAGAGDAEIALYKDFAARGALPLRLYVMLAGADVLRRWQRPELELGGGFLTIRSVKLYADGALGSRGAALLEPYADDPGNSGLLTTPPEALLEATRLALSRGFQVNTHAIGDRGNRIVLDTYEKALRERPEVKDHRFRIEHAQILDERDIPRFAALGVIASMQGIHATSDRPWAAQRLGDARVAEGAYVWQKLLKSGARIVNGSDAPVEPVNPILGFYASVTRQDASGQPPGGFDPDQRMTREQALRSFTSEAAYATFSEATSGTLERGKRADLTVLSRDILSVPEAEILGTRVLYTIVDGKVRHAAAGAP